MDANEIVNCAEGWNYPGKEENRPLVGLTQEREPLFEDAEDALNDVSSAGVTKVEELLCILRPGW